MGCCGIDAQAISVDGLLYMCSQLPRVFGLRGNVPFGARRHRRGTDILQIQVASCGSGSGSGSHVATLAATAEDERTVYSHCQL